MPVSLLREEERHVLQILPILLKRDRKFQTEVYSVLSETFATKDDLKQILEEMRISREETAKRFEAMDRRFETMDKRFEAMDRRFEDQADWVGVVVGGFQRRAGRSLEDAIAGTLRVVLKRKDLKPESLKLRQKLLDDEGIVGPKGRSYEIDLYIHNSESMIFEIKSYAETEDALRFNDKAELAKKKLDLPHVSKVFITLQKGRDMADICQEFGIELV